MAPGLNLWNTLDAHGNWVTGLATETAWGQPVTTREMVTAMKTRGFRTLRVPVTWYQHLGAAPDYTIDKAWLDRVEEVLGYALDNGMYAIVNIHHDDYDATKTGSWLSPTYARQEAVTDELVKVWTQIATRLKDYDQHLLFETMNEPREIGSAQEWTGGSAEHRAVVNALNLAAVNAIRATGGNNATRFIMTPQVGAHTAALNDLVIPNDDPNIIVAVHNYDPYFFTIAPADGGGVTTWGTDAEIANLQATIKRYHDKFVASGRAVVIGEWGAADKSNLDARLKYYEVYAKACADNQITPIAWIYDFDRKTLEWKNPSLEDKILSVFPSK
jgi:endoglucanase